MGQVGREMKPVLHTAFRIPMNMNSYRNKVLFIILSSAPFPPQFLSAQSILLSIWALNSHFQKDSYYFSRIIILFFPTTSIHTLGTKIKIGFLAFLHFTLLGRAFKLLLLTEKSSCNSSQAVPTFTTLRSSALSNSAPDYWLVMSSLGIVTGYFCSFPNFLLLLKRS